MSRSLLRACVAITAAALMLSGVSLVAADGGDDALLTRLKDSKHSLAEGIKQSEKANGVAISAKFEMDGDKLILSVYTAKCGLGSDSEHNVFIELGGDASASPWAPETEVFEDKKHLTRSAMQLTLVQLSKLTLVDVIKKAEGEQPGTVYSVTPSMKNGSPVFSVKVANGRGKSVQLIVDGVTGSVSK